MTKGAFRVHFAERRRGCVSSNTASFDVTARDAIHAVTIAHKLANRDKELEKLVLVVESVDLLAWLDS